MQKLWLSLFFLVLIQIAYLNNFYPCIFILGVSMPSHIKIECRLWQIAFPLKV